MMKVTLGSHPSTCADLNNLSKIYEELGVHVTHTISRTPDSVFHRDVMAWTRSGLIKCNMGNESRKEEPTTWFNQMHKQPILDIEKISPTATFEGADLLWITPNEALLGVGDRTNLEGATIVQTFLENELDCEVTVVALPSWHNQHLLGVANYYRGVIFMVCNFGDKEIKHVASKYPIKLVPHCFAEMKLINFVVVNQTLVVPTGPDVDKEDVWLELNQPTAMHGLDISGLLSHGGGIACATGIYEY